MTSSPSTMMPPLMATPPPTTMPPPTATTPPSPTLLELIIVITVIGFVSVCVQFCAITRKNIGTGENSRACVISVTICSKRVDKKFGYEAVDLALYNIMSEEYNILINGIEEAQWMCSLGRKGVLMPSLTYWFEISVFGYYRALIYMICVGNAWREAALLLAAGAKGNDSALLLITLMTRQPIATFHLQAIGIQITRKAIKKMEDITHRKYFSPSEAAEYEVIDKVIHDEQANENGGVIADLKKSSSIRFKISAKFQGFPIQQFILEAQKCSK